MHLNKSIPANILMASVALANTFTNSDWTTLSASGHPSGAVTSHTGSFAIAVVPVTTGTWTSKATAGAAQLEAQSIAAQGSDGSTAVAATASTATPAASGSLYASASVVNDAAVSATDAVATDATATDTLDTDATDAADTAVSGDDATNARKRHILHTRQGATTLVRRDDESYATASAVNNFEQDDVAQDNVDSNSSSDPITTVSCAVNGTLSMTLKNGILEDSKGRIGAIVSNRQFQFDGPPQAGTIYANGWSITSDGYLAIGTTDVFYRCLSGSFYNLYDQNVAYQCAPIRFLATGFADC